MADENEGHGGSYIVDKDGKRTLVHRTAELPAASEKPKGKKAKSDEVKDA